MFHRNGAKTVLMQPLKDHFLWKCFCCRCHKNARLEIPTTTVTYNQTLDDRNVSIRFHLGGGLGNDWRNSAAATEAQDYKISKSFTDYDSGCSSAVECALHDQECGFGSCQVLGFASLSVVFVCPCGALMIFWTKNGCWGQKSSMRKEWAKRNKTSPTQSIEFNQQLILSLCSSLQKAAGLYF